MRQYWPIIIASIFCIAVTLLISYWIWGRDTSDGVQMDFAPNMAYAAAKGKASTVLILAFESDTDPGNRQPGSGVIISSDGYIVTNYHVIAGGVRVQIQMHNRHEYTAQVIGVDSIHDVALLKINATGLPYLEIGNSDSLRIGEQVVAIGNPYRLHGTVTGGIVSGKDRDMKMPNNATANYIQTDAAINQGNSGGPLLNSEGQFMGLNTGMITSSGQYEGFSFTIPSNLIKKITNDIIQYGSLQRASLGMMIREVTGEIAQEAGLKGIYGVVVETLKPGGSADAAGIQSLDILTSINGHLIISSAYFRGHLDLFNPGDVISLGLVRNGIADTLEVKLQESEVQR